MAKLIGIIWNKVMIVASVLFLFASCTTEEAEVAVTGVNLDESSLLLFPEQTQKLTATVVPENAANKNVTWSSDDTAVAVVSEDGSVTAVAVGDAVITVTTADGGYTATCNVTVMANRVNVESVSLDETALTVNRGETAQLTATVLPDNASVKDVTWTSSNPDIATVNEEGLVSAIALGNTTITVTTVDGGKTATCEVTVDDDAFTVSFDTDGAPEIQPVTVNKGDRLTKPEDPVKGGIDAGLYEGNIDPDSGSSTFAGWYTDADFTAEYNFDTPVTTDFTLYAKWETTGAPQPIELTDATGAPVDFASNPLKASIEWLNVNATEGGDYTIVLTSDCTSGNSTFNLGDDKKDTEINLYIKGQQQMRTLELRFSYTELKGSAHLYIGKNVKLTCNGIEMFRMSDKSRIYMLEGSQIADCNATTQLGVIYLQSADAYFYLQGGEIINNQVTSRTDGFSRCAVICSDNGRVRIESGRIANNTVTASASDRILAGAIVTNSANWNQDSIQMTGGVIENNTAVYPEGMTGYAAQQVMATVRDVYTPIYGIDSNIAEGTTFSTFNWDAEWTSPWVNKAVN